MDAGSALDRRQRLALVIIELRPVSLADALSSWRYGAASMAAGRDADESFEAAVGVLMVKGLVRLQDDGSLTITVAGRAALTWV